MLGSVLFYMLSLSLTTLRLVNSSLVCRFGQSVLQDCEYCHTYYEYALYAIPRPLLGYIREAAIIGLLTVRGSRKERWRIFAIGAIVCAAIAEEYWISTVQIKIPNHGRGVIMVCGCYSIPHLLCYW